MEAALDNISKRIEAIRFLVTLCDDPRLEETAKRGISFQLLKDTAEISDICVLVSELSLEIVLQNKTSNKTESVSTPKVDKKVSASSSEEDLVETKKVVVKAKKTVK